MISPGPAERYNILLNQQVLLLKNLNLVRSKSGPQAQAPCEWVGRAPAITFHIPIAWNRLPPKPKEGRFPPLDSRLLLSRVLTLGHLTHLNVSSMATVTTLHCPKKNDGESTTPLIVSFFLLLFFKNAYLDKLQVRSFEMDQSEGEGLNSS